MADDRPSGEVMRDAGLVALPGMIRPREGRAWLVEWQGTRGVLRRVPAPADPNTRAVLMADLAWLHVFLARLGELGFPSPRPLPSFGGSSWTIADGLPVLQLCLASDRRNVLVQVWDSSCRTPRRQDAPLDAESGRGLLLVEHLSAQWGCYIPEASAGKVVWAIATRAS